MDKRTVWAAGAVTGILGALLVGVNIHEREQAKAQRDQIERLAEQLTPVEVTYFVDGTAKTVSITTKTPTGTSQATTSLPLMNNAGSAGLHHQFTRGATVYVAAQNEGEFGTVTCHIEVAGREIARNTASGSYGIATCQGSAY